MIPKIIHYCWFGGNPLPPLAQECIASWRKFLPEYEIREWNEENFDVNLCPYTAEAYRQRKFAFVSDYARFWILHRYGGLYFDTDVEVIRPIGDIVERGNFMGFETDPDGENSPEKYAPRYAYGVALGLGFGMEAGHPFLQEMLDRYHAMEFAGAEMSPWLKTIVAYTTEALVERGLRNVPGIQQAGDITVYPAEYFAPINVMTGRLRITPNTRTIHRYMGSWDGKKQGQSLKQRLRGLLPDWVFVLNNRWKRRNYKYPQKP